MKIGIQLFRTKSSIRSNREYTKLLINATYFVVMMFLTPQ